MSPTDPQQEEIGWKSGVWYASTMGRFMPLLLDRGPRDNTIIWREVETLAEDPETGEFISHMEILIVPDGQVLDIIHDLERERKFGGADKVLRQLIEAGLVT